MNAVWDDKHKSRDVSDHIVQTDEERRKVNGSATIYQMMMLNM